MDKNFAQIVEDQCDHELVDLGFKRPRKGTRYLEITKDFLGWAGLNRGRVEGHLRINPFIGIHCVPIMKLRAELQGKKYQKGRYATYAVHLGEISPHSDQFVFESESDIVSEARRLSVTIGNHAVPWMLGHANYGSLLPLIETRFEMLGGYPQSLALGYFLSGTPKKARDLIDSNPQIFYENETDPQSIYNRFTKPFLQTLNDESAEQD